MQELLPELKLFFAPGACSRVLNIVLEEIGAPFETHLVKFMAGEHKSPDYLKLNPKAKVPLLVVDGVALSENVAILLYLHKTFPDARLFPPMRDAMAEAQIVSDLAWCSSGLHPIVTRLRGPQWICDVPAARQRLWDMAAAAMAPNFALLEARLEDQPWMLGETWSALDAYVFWIWGRCSGAGFDVSPYPRFAAHAARMLERPATQRAIAREDAAEKWLDENGLQVDMNAAKK